VGRAVVGADPLRRSHIFSSPPLSAPENLAAPCTSRPFTARRDHHRCRQCGPSLSDTPLDGSPGTVVGRNWAGVADNPCRVKSIPRPIPPRQWYLTPAVVAFLGGLLPFGSIFIEMYFIFTSFWNYKVCQLSLSLSHRPLTHSHSHSHDGSCPCSRVLSWAACLLLSARRASRHNTNIARYGTGGRYRYRYTATKGRSRIPNPPSPPPRARASPSSLAPPSTRAGRRTPPAVGCSNLQRRISTCKIQSSTARGLSALPRRRKADGLSHNVHSVHRQNSDVDRTT